jgi:DNA polymerase III epsilon subunit-like protein
MSATKAAFVVIDTESTGFSAKFDRVIELAIVPFGPNGLPMLEKPPVWRFDPEGRRSEKGAYEAHGIRDEDLVGEHLFRQVARLVWKCLEGRVVVGHCLDYDLKMLKAEFGRISELPDVQRAEAGVAEKQYTILPPISGQFCTLKAYKAYRDGDVVMRGSSAKAVKYSAKLADACAYFGVFNELAHSAWGDASATGRIAVKLAQLSGRLGELGLREEDLDVVYRGIDPLEGLDSLTS